MRRRTTTGVAALVIGATLWLAPIGSAGAQSPSPTVSAPSPTVPSPTSAPRAATPTTTAGGADDGNGGSLTVAPLRVEPGGEVTITVECPTVPWVAYGRGIDVVAAVSPDQLQAGTSTVVIRAEVVDDLPIEARCGGGRELSVLVDVEHPRISIPGSFDAGGQPGTASILLETLSDLRGTDCPEGTDASIRITSWSYGMAADGEVSTVETRPTDGFGDWSLTGLMVTAEAIETLDPVAPGTIMRELRLDASCGDVHYPRVTMVLQRSEGHGRLTLPPVAPPAGALPGSAGYTG